MLNSEQRKIYAAACLAGPLEALAEDIRTGYDPREDFMKLVDRARGHAVLMASVSQGFALTYFEIMEAMRIAKPAQYAMTVEMLVERYVEGGLNR